MKRLHRGGRVEKWGEPPYQCEGSLCEAEARASARRCGAQRGVRLVTRGLKPALYEQQITQLPVMRRPVEATQSVS